MSKNKFFNTAFGKSIKTAFWITLAYAISLGTAAVANYHFPVSVAILGVPGLVNILLYTAKVFVDKEIPNLPNSPVKVLMTIPPATNVVTTPASPQ